MTDQHVQRLVEEVAWLGDLRQRRPDINRVVTTVLVTRGWRSLAELATEEPEFWTPFFQGLYDVEEMVGDGDPDAPNPE